MALDVTALVSAVVSLIGAALSVGSAIWIHKRQRNIQLFEKRVEIYNATCAFLGHPQESGRPHEVSQLYDFLRETRNAEFLFGSEIKQLLDRVYSKAAEYRTKYNVWEKKTDAHPEKDALFEQQCRTGEELQGLWKAVDSGFPKTS